MGARMSTVAARRRIAAVLVAGAASFALVSTSVVASPPAEAATAVVAPLPAKTYSLSSYYGPRCMPVAGASTWHLGQDMGAASGVRVSSIADGVVLHAGAAGGLGQWVVVKHTIGGRTVSSVYGHVLDGDRYVRVGQKVTAGQRIADVGSTGTSTSPHLHLEIWNGAYGSGASHTDPLAYLKGVGVDLARSATRVAARTVPSSCTYYTNADVNLRSGPSTSSSALTVVPRASVLTAKPGAGSGSWRQVTYGTRTGWMLATYVTPKKPAASPAGTGGSSGSTSTVSYVNVSWLNLRSGPSTSAGVLTRLARGTAVTHVGAASNGWQKVKVGTRTGYVSAALLSATKPAAPAPAAKPTGTGTGTVSYVTASSLNLRSGPSTSSTVLARLARGSAVTHLATPSRGWVKVKAGTRTGYVSTAHLSRTRPATTTADGSAGTAVSYVSVSVLNLRAQASTSSAILAKLPRGTAVTHLGSPSKGWLRVKAAGRTGFVSTAHLSATRPR